MAKVKAIIVRAPGTNCDEETAHAFSVAGASATIHRLQEILENPGPLNQVQIFCVPGGFSFGDDLAAGRIFAFKLKRIAEHLHRFRDNGGLIMGICNGFQVLMQTGLLLSHSEQGQPRATLTQNAHGRFEDRWIRLKLTPGQCAFVREATEIELPIAHGEGRFVVDSPTVLDELEQSQRITCQYVNELGKTDGFPVNPNGSERGIAGICDDTGRVFALMPHPERHLTPFQHPTWTRRETQPEHGDGFYFFHNAVQFFS